MDKDRKEEYVIVFGGGGKEASVVDADIIMNVDSGGSGDRIHIGIWIVISGRIFIGASEDD